MPEQPAVVGLEEAGHLGGIVLWDLGVVIAYAHLRSRREVWPVTHPDPHGRASGPFPHDNNRASWHARNQVN